MEGSIAADGNMHRMFSLSRGIRFGIDDGYLYLFVLSDDDLFPSLFHVPFLQGNDARLHQNFNMFRNGADGSIQLLRDIPDAEILFGEQTQDIPSGLASERFGDRVQSFVLCEFYGENFIFYLFHTSSSSFCP